MDLSDLSVAKRTETVLLALDWALQDLTSPATTGEITALIAKRLRSKEAGQISRIIVKAADRVPEAARGDTFKRFGKSMRRVIWWPKGQLPDGRGITRKALRDQRTMTAEEMHVAYYAERNLDPVTGLPLAQPTSTPADPADIWSV